MIPPGFAIWRASSSQYSFSIGLNVFQGAGTTASDKMSPALPQTSHSSDRSCSCQPEVLKVIRSIMMARSLLQRSILKALVSNRREKCEQSYRRFHNFCKQAITLIENPRLLDPPPWSTRLPTLKSMPHMGALPVRLPV